MRIAILSDIHGNLPAFEATLEHAQRQRVDQLIIAGDIVIGSPDTAACWRLARELGCPIVRGNHERYVAHCDTPVAPAEWAGEQFAPLRWGARQLTNDERASIEQLPLSLRLPEAPDLLIVHASTRSDHDSIAAYTPDPQLAAMFEGIDQQVIARAHNHLAQTRPWGDRLIISAGSVGLPLDGNPSAQYLILERRKQQWRFEHHSVPYDLDATLRRFHKTGYLTATGPIGRLYMREVATASHQIVPFLRAYRRWSETEMLSLDAALERFLQIF
jgi:predicted phosphodiesterase